MVETIKGTLKFGKKKKGTQMYMVKYLTKKGKEACPSISQSALCFKESDAVDGMEVDIELKNGQPQKITIPDKEVTGGKQVSITSNRPRPQQHKGGRGPGKPGGGLPLTNGTAPYNFIPYDFDSILTGFQVPDRDTWSGSISIQLEALTPLLVCGSQEGDSNIRTFFEVDNQYAVPGTSLKGMLRSYLETISFSRLAPINSHPLFQRDIQGNDYLERFVSNGELQVKAGYLYTEGTRQYIAPCKMAKVGHKELSSFFKTKIVDKEQYNSKARKIGHNRDLSFDLKFNKKSPTPRAVNLYSAGQGKQGGQVVFTGFMPKKNKEYIYYDESSLQLTVTREMHELFLEQITKEQASKIDDCRGKYGKNGKGLPVFYLEEAGKIFFFGLAQMFRIPYERSIGEMAGGADGTLDFCQSLFGTTAPKAVRGRVSCGAAMASKINERRKEIKTVLGKPQGTALSLYLEQDEQTVYSKNKMGKTAGKANWNLTDYNKQQAKLRGRKRYWHRELAPVKPPNENVNVQSILKPLGSGSSFTFSINLDRVSELELGALFMALELPEGHAHKLGLAKSMGLGSVKLSIATTNLVKDSTRYESLAARFKQNKETDFDAEKLELCRQQFRKEILTRLQEKGRTEKNFEELPEIKNLKVMTDFVNKPAKEKTAMMQLSDYSSKPILKTPTETAGVE